MPFLGHGHHPVYPEQLMYTAKCDGCSNVVKFTTSTDPTSDLEDMDWVFDGDDCARLLCSDCNPKAPGNRTEIPKAFRD